MALARGLSWLERPPVHQAGAGSIPGQGTYLGFGFGPWSEHIQEASNQCLFLTSVFLSLSLPFSLSKINKYIIGLGFSKEKIMPGIKIEPISPVIQKLCDSGETREGSKFSFLK